MSGISSVLPYIQIVLSVLLMAAILLQQNEAGLGAAFGSTNESVHRTRRGFERFLFGATIVLAVLFALSALLALIRF
ncbi:preprotein translocase subunit SecG [Mycobacterium tuberculosis]|uniref:preprotein translocase subunit SecG n=1 Tax=Mycobacterium tuberculosis TaxID=1773 RepID=UPI000D36CBFF